MKKNTIIAFMVVLIYCSFATYGMLYEIGNDGHFLEPIYPDWFMTILSPGFLLGFILGYTSGIISLWIGQIITFIILFFLFKSFLNWFLGKFETRKN